MNKTHLHENEKKNSLHSFLCVILLSPWHGTIESWAWGSGRNASDELREIQLQEWVKYSFCPGVILQPAELGTFEAWAAAAAAAASLHSLRQSLCSRSWHPHPACSSSQKTGRKHFPLIFWEFIPDFFFLNFLDLLGQCWHCTLKNLYVILSGKTKASLFCYQIGEKIPIYEFIISVAML